MEFTEEEKKANKKAYDKKYYEKNKERWQAYFKKYREEHSEEIKENIKKWRENNKGETKEYNKKWRENNKGYDEEYRQTPKGVRVNRINNWKQRGMLEPEEGWEAFAEMVLNTTNCAECGIELTEDRYNTRTTRCVDHSHITGLFRNVVCHSCNSGLPRGT